MRISAWLAAAILLSPLSAFAADAAKQPETPGPIKTLVRQGAELRYLGNDQGMDGWLTIKDGAEQYFYVTPDGQAIVMGVLFNNKGDIVTARQIDALRKKEPGIDNLTNPTATVPDQTAAMTQTTTAAPKEEAAKTPAKSSDKAQQLFAAVEGANWITLGQKNAPAIYSFIDPQCPHCHAMIDDFRSSGLMDQGLVSLRLIPVGLMNDTSLKQAANLLASNNPAADLYKHLGGDETALMQNSDPNTQGVQKNIALFQEWKLDVTPFSVYKDISGTIRIIRGRPENLAELVGTLK